MLWRKTLTYWKSIIVACIIAYGCLLRKPLFTLPTIDGGDKGMHCLAFMILTLTLLWDSHNTRLKSWTKYTLATTIPAIYGGFIEIIQHYFLAPRTGDWMDWIADCIGILLGLGIWIISQKCYERRTNL